MKGKGLSRTQSAARTSACSNARLAMAAASMLAAAVCLTPAEPGRAQTLPGVTPYLSHPDARAIERRIMSETRQIRQHVKDRAWEKAKAIGEPLLKQISVAQAQGLLSGPRDEAAILAINAIYAMVLVELGDLEEGVGRLSRLIEKDLSSRYGPAVSANQRRMSPLTTLALSRSMEELNWSQDRFILQRVGADPEEIRSFSGVLDREDALPLLDIPQISLIRAHLKAGNPGKAAQAYRDEFTRFLDELSQLPGRHLVNLVEELACFQTAVEFASLGRNPQSDQSFECALSTSAQVNSQMWTAAAATDLQIEAWAQRSRAIAGAYLSYLVASNGSTPLSPEDKDRVVKLIAETKGAASIYRSRRRAAITASNTQLMRNAREMYQQTEGKLFEFVLDSSRLHTAVAEWIEHENAINRMILAELRSAMRAHIPKPGKEIVHSVRERLKSDRFKGGAAYIGYFSYRPFDPATQKLQDSRILRYVMTSASASVDISDIGTARQIRSDVMNWRERHLQQDLADASASGRAESARADQALTNLVLGDLPDAARLARHWIIDPDAMLNLLPFEALFKPGAGNAHADLVLDHHVVSYTSSMAEFAEVDKARNAARPWKNYAGTALVVADPAFEADPLRVGQADLARTRRASALGRVRVAGGQVLGDVVLDPLPETRAEALAVRDALEAMGVSSKLHLGKDASTLVFELEQPPAVVHIATHGLFLEPGVRFGSDVYVNLSAALPGLQSALALAPAKGERFLTGSDIARLPLQGTQLVVLSACDTGNGEVLAGEGVVSLRRSIEEAGALSSVTSLWAVPSRATTELMSAFYGELAKGKSKAVALRLAKLETRRKHPSPRYWGAFLLAGEP